MSEIRLLNKFSLFICVDLDKIELELFLVLLLRNERGLIDNIFLFNDLRN